MQKYFLFILTFIIFSVGLLAFGAKVFSAGESALIRFSGEPEVYFVKDKKLLHVPSLQAFEGIGYRWSDVIELGKSEKSKYSRMKLIKTEDSPKIYYLTESEMKRHIINPQVFLSYNNKWEDVVAVDKKQLDFYPENNLIRGIGDFKIYKLENGKKRWIKDSESFRAFGFDWAKIAPVNAIELNAYPDGETIEKTSVAPTPTLTPASAPAPTPTPTRSQFQLQLQLLFLRPLLLH